MEGRLIRTRSNRGDFKFIAPYYERLSCGRKPFTEIIKPARSLRKEYLGKLQRAAMQVDSPKAEYIRAKLKAAFPAAVVEVLDESHKHAGHAHASRRPGIPAGPGGTHFSIKVISEDFKGKSRLERHRQINDLLQAEFGAGMHALAIEAKAPGE